MKSIQSAIKNATALRLKHDRACDEIFFILEQYLPDDLSEDVHVFYQVGDGYVLASEDKNLTNYRGAPANIPVEAIVEVGSKIGKIPFSKLKSLCI